MTNKAKINYELVKKLNGIDSKLKFKKEWNQAVTNAFNSTGSFCFENLVYADYCLAESLYVKFK